MSAHSSSRSTPAARDRATGAWLTYCDPDGEIHEVYLISEGSRVTVGRSIQADVTLSHDGTVSRLHATFEMIGGRVTVADESLSLNGTFVNGTRINGHRALNPGDVVRIGDTEFAYEGTTCTEMTGASGVNVTLTTGQRRVLTELCRPFRNNTYAIPASNQQVADRLGIAVPTVKSHIRALFEKFGVNDLPNEDKRRQLVTLAMLTGVVDTDDRSAQQ